MNLTRPALPSDTDFARATHHLAYRDVVARQFGVWDETAQDQFFAVDWEPARFEIVICDGEPCGYVCIEDVGSDVYVRELVIAPAAQGRGIGSAVLCEVIARANRRHVPVLLQTLRLNRAIVLYERLGFKAYARTDTHVLMERAWDAESPE